MFSKTAILGAAVVVATANAGKTWQLSGFNSTSVGGVFATSADECYVAFSENDFGPGVGKTVDACETWEKPQQGGGLNTDVARDTMGNLVVSTIGAIFISHNDGPLQQLDSPDITFSQNVETFGKSSFGVTGTHYPTGLRSPQIINGVALSTDGANTWEYYDTGLDWDKYCARYSAFPSDSTWYVAHGSWSSSSNSRSSEAANPASWELHSNIVQHSRDGFKYQKSVGASMHYGAISKTTDGGATFQKVFDSKDQYYMNMIDCASETTCMVCAQNAEDAFVLRTENGGKSWDTVLSLSAPAGASLAALKMLSEDEAWTSGGTFEKGMVGWYYHTVDGGKTWEQHTLDQAYSLDLSFADGNGYSPAMKELGSSVSVYK